MCCKPFHYVDFYFFSPVQSLVVTDSLQVDFGKHVTLFKAKWTHLAGSTSLLQRNIKFAIRVGNEFPNARNYLIKRVSTLLVSVPVDVISTVKRVDLVSRVLCSEVSREGSLRSCIFLWALWAQRNSLKQFPTWLTLMGSPAAWASWLNPGHLIPLDI